MENKSAVPGARKAEDTARNMPEGERLLRLLADVSEDAAVNVQDEAVDEVGSVGGEEDGGAAQIVSLAPAASGGLGDDEADRRDGGCRRAGCSRRGAVCGVAM